MTETMFVRLHEYNDHEGERWNWWLQLTDNSDEIDKLAELLLETEAGQDFDLWYTLHVTDIEPESVVNKLVEYSECGYNYSNNKVDGKFVCPDSLGDDADLLYKGGINAFFKECR